MKSCGGIPESSMDSYVKSIEKGNRLEKQARDQDLMLAKAKETIAHQDLMLTKSHGENVRAQAEIAELKAT